MSKRFCTFGDSIAYGADDRENGGWASLLQLRYWKEYNIGNFFNLSIDGETTSGLLKHLASEAMIRRAGVIIIAIGINDSITYKTRDPEISEEEFTKNVRTILNQAKQQTDFVAWIGLTRVDESKTNPYPGSKSGKCYTNERIELFDKIIASVCGEMNVPYISMHNVVDPGSFNDGLHPDTQAHEIMAREIDKFLKEINYLPPIGNSK